MQINPYLNFNGQCESAFKFYEKVLGGKIDVIMPMKGSPVEEQMGPGCGGNILHARMTIGDTVVMASDCPPDNYDPPKGFSINIGVGSPEEAERIFNALSENGQVQMPLEKTFWAKKFGMVTDQFGTPWMINCE